MLEDFELGQEDVINTTELYTGTMNSIINGEFVIHVSIHDCLCDVTLLAGKRKCSPVNEYDFGTVQAQQLNVRYFWEDFYNLINDAIQDLLIECYERGIEIDPKRPMPDPNKRQFLVMLLNYRFGRGNIKSCGDVATSK